MGVTRISLSVSSSDDNVVVRATEHFARAATGLALDGMDCVMFVGPDEEEAGDDE